MVICIKCHVTKHKPHVTRDLHEALEEAKDQLTEDAKRLQQAVDYLVAKAETSREEGRSLGDERAAVEADINDRCDMMSAMIEQLRHHLLTSLDDTCNVIQGQAIYHTDGNQSNLDQLHQLQQQVQQAVSSGKASQLLNVAKEMREGRGSVKAVDILQTAKRKQVIRPTLHFTLSNDGLKKLMKEALRATVIMEVNPPEVDIKERFCCGPETDINVFHLCPMDDNVLWVSYEVRGGKHDALRECFDWSGRFLRLDNRTTHAGKATAQAQGNGKCSVMPYTDGDLVHSFSKGQRETAIMLCSKASAGLCVGYVEHLSDLSKSETKPWPQLAMPGPQRAFDVDASQRNAAVLLKATPRHVVLYQANQQQPVATYTPPSPRCRPSDVCFFKLGKEEVLLVADEGTDSIHVLRVQDGTVTFLRYLAPGCPLLVQPTALNTDHTGQLWVACKGGVIITIRPVE
jgi:hypothetical protein